MKNEVDINDKRKAASIRKVAEAVRKAKDPGDLQSLEKSVVEILERGCFELGVHADGKTSSKMLYRARQLLNEIQSNLHNQPSAVDFDKWILIEGQAQLGISIWSHHLKRNNDAIASGVPFNSDSPTEVPKP